MGDGSSGTSKEKSRAGAAGPSRGSRIGPDRPPWGLASALALLLASYFAEPFLRHSVITLFRLAQARPSQTFAFVYPLVELPLSDLLMLAVVWTFVTGGGRRPFLRTLGWSWPARLRVREVEGKRFSAKWVTIFLGLLVASVGGFLAGVIGGPETRLDQSFEVSPWVPAVTAMTAVATAPFLEEFVYRGVLYPALQRRLGGRRAGKIAAVLIISALFFYIHVRIYSSTSGSPHAGKLTAIALGALAFTGMRAYSRRLLPSYVMHLVFNLFGTVTMLWSLLLKHFQVMP